ncbi:MAG TPA: FtsX-like permease family protein [Acidimicrobiales bacterium]|nr:FtsX-like permease family protein [Acidimicrobiales bacterium]
MVRWAWRLFRREWRQQLLVLALIIVAVTATVVGSAVAINTPLPANTGLGTAQDMATFAGSDPRLAAEIVSLEHRFGKVDVIENETLKVPGSVDTYQLRAQNPDGPYGQPTLSLVSGHYPTAADQVAVTAGVASEFNLKVDDIWKVGGASRQVAGIVENPQSLLDEFALVLPGQVKSPNDVTVLFDAPGVAPSSIGEQCATCGPYGASGSNVSTPASAAQSNQINPETLSLAVLTIGMLLIALVAVGGFTVLAQRRQRSLGMLASIGATSKNVSLVVRANGLVVGVLGAVIGTLLGLAAWFAYRPSLEQSSHHLIGVLALPWVVVAAAIVLAIVATYLAASRPARSITRLSVMAALSGRPAPPKQVRRSALPGIVFLVVAFLLLGYSGSTRAGSGSAGTPELVLGIVVLFPAVILLAPFFLVGLGGLARHTPVAARVALRDLARYRARSASALAAISLGVMIAVIIAIFAQARYADIWDPAGPNLASNQANIETGPRPSAQQVKSWAQVAARVGEVLGAQQVAALYVVGNLQNSTGSESSNQPLTVATPQLLRVLGIHQSAIAPDADVVTSLPGFAGASGLEFAYCEKSVPSGQSNGGLIQSFNCTKNGGLTHPVIQYLAALPTGVHAPDMLLTEHAVHELGISSSVIGLPIAWFANAAEPITADQIHNAQAIAATANLSIETRNDEPTSGELIDWATAAGMAIALSILAMSIGLIRSESARDLRTLAAAGASSYTRRTLTAITAAALGFSGAILGTLAGYVAVIGWLRSSSLHGGLSSLANVPVPNLLAILVGLPLLAAVAAWLLAGRQPPAIARQPIE